MFDRPFHEPFRHTRFFHRGDMKYVVLDILKEKPSHGYEIIQVLDERFHGIYSPNPGSVYPVLQLLEDMGYVTASPEEGKKVYTVTEAGKTFLEQQRETADKIRGRLRGMSGGDAKDFLNQIKSTLNQCREIRGFISYAASRKDPVKITKLNEILGRALREIKHLYGEPF